MSRERPPRTDIPRNLSFIAALTERAYYRSQRPSLEEEPEEEPGEGGTRLGARSRALASSRGRRARSAPAGSGGARASRSRSPDTRKRVRFADALGLELAAVRRFRPGELPRVPRHVQVQLQRDALRHFVPCQSRTRGLQVSGRGTPLLPDLSISAVAGVGQWISQGMPIPTPNPGLALALPFWGPHWRGRDSRPLSQLGRTLMARTPGSALDWSNASSAPAPISVLPSLGFQPPSLPLSSPGGARRPGAGQRARLCRPLAGAAHLSGTRRGGPAGSGWQCARAGLGLRETRERALECRRLAEPTRGARCLCRPGPAPAAR